jgi:hypothetical protein
VGSFIFPPDHVAYDCHFFDFLEFERFLEFTVGDSFGGYTFQTTSQSEEKEESEKKMKKTKCGAFLFLIFHTEMVTNQICESHDFSHGPLIFSGVA